MGVVCCLSCVVLVLTGDDEVRVSRLVHPSGNTTINTSTGLERGGGVPRVCVCIGAIGLTFFDTGAQIGPLDLRFSIRELKGVHFHHHQRARTSLEFAFCATHMRGQNACKVHVPR